MPDSVTVAGDSRDRDTVDAQRHTPMQDGVWLSHIGCIVPSEEGCSLIAHFLF